MIGEKVDIISRQHLFTYNFESDSDSNTLRNRFWFTE